MHMSMPFERIFEVSGLSKRFGAIAALSDVSFEVRAGEVLGLIGPNGAGKSTLFECLGGVLPCDSGEVRAGGHTVGVRERPSLLFYVPDGIAPWPSQSVGWGLDFTVGFFGGRAELLGEVVEQLDLGRLLPQPIGTLSKGQRKRALLAIGLLSPQPALLIDEPFEGLDLRQARDIAAACASTQHAAARCFFRSIKSAMRRASATASCCLAAGSCAAKGRWRNWRRWQRRAMLRCRPRSRGENYGDLEEVFLALT